MTSEKDVIASLLRLTKTGPIQKELLRKDARVSVQVLDEALRKLFEDGFIRQKRGLVEVSSSQRVSMAVQALKLGADFERICKFLEWTEFESIAAQAFQANGFRVLKNFRFKHAGKRWEIDVLSCKEPLIVCVDCKHWQRGWNRAATVKAVEAQVERTRAFADALPNYYQKARLAEWKSATLVPLILSLVHGPFKFHNKVPIVPVLQLQDFINELPLELSLLTHFKKKIVKINEILTDYSK
jgi:Holliday junction resolvase-like predicted endonuclease